MTEATLPADAPVLLYDGVCGLCNSAVKLVLRHDKQHTMRFAALDSDFGLAVAARHPELASADSMAVVDRAGQADEQVRLRSDGALRVARYLGGLWLVFLPLTLIPRSLRDAAYNLLARVRYRLFGRYDTCPLPPPEVRARFLP